MLSETEAQATHPILAQLLALLEQEITNPGPIVKALIAYLMTLLTPAQATELLNKCKAAAAPTV